MNLKLFSIISIRDGKLKEELEIFDWNCLEWAKFRQTKESDLTFLIYHQEFWRCEQNIIGCIKGKEMFVPVWKGKSNNFESIVLVFD